MKKFIIFLLFLYGILYSVTIEVKQDGTGDYTTIQAGIDAAQDNDVVLVYPGTYYENLTISDKDITLASLEYATGDESYIEQTIIDGNMNDSVIYLFGQESTVIVEGFTIKNGKGHPNSTVGRIGGGLYIDINLNVQIKNCVIKDNFAEAGGGIYTTCNILNLEKVTIKNNYANLGGAIFDGYHTNFVFSSSHRCNIYDNNAGSGRDLFAGTESNNINVIIDTFTVMNPDSYFACHFNEDAHFNFDILHSYIQPIDSDLYVATTGNDNNSGLTENEPLQTISKAMQLIASNPDNPHTIHLAPGTYSQTLNNQFFPIGIKSNVTLQGDEEDRPILLNEGIPETENYIFLNMLQDSYCIENIILHQGFDNIQDILFDFKSNNIVLKNITIENFIVNREYPTCPFDGNNVNLINVNFNNVTNLAEPTPYLMNCNLKMNDCSFNNNRSTVSGSWSTGTIGITITAVDSVKIENCKFTNNQSSADYSYEISIDPAQFENPKVEIKNVLCANNQTNRGVLGLGTSYDWENMHEKQVVNCTFANNTSYPYGSILIGKTRLTNCIFYNPSTLNEIKLPDLHGSDIYSVLTVDHCLIKEGYNGIYNENNVNTINWLEGNIAGDPQFMDDGNYPFALSSTSPCIDAGTTDLPEGVTLPETDLAGNPRVSGSTVDIGAYEYQDGGYSEPEELPPVRFTYVTVYPNPFRIGGSKRNRMIFKVTLAEAGNVKASVYNLKGEKVAEITDAYLSPGVYRSKWDGKDDNGKKISSGMYLIKLTENGKITRVSRFTVIK